jgi:hypothetical protein
MAQEIDEPLLVLCNLLARAAAGWAGPVTTAGRRCLLTPHAPSSHAGREE